MKKFQLQLDTESINLENEMHSNNFPIKVKNLAEHCVNYIIGTHDINNCNDKKYNREIHDQVIFPTPINNIDEESINTQNHTYIYNNQNKKTKYHVYNFKSKTRKFLL